MIKVAFWYVLYQIAENRKKGVADVVAISHKKERFVSKCVRGF